MITSKENKKIKYIKHLRNNKFSSKEGKFIIEGSHLVEEASKSGVLLETYSVKEVNFGVLNNLVTDEILKSLSSLPSVPDVIGICKMFEKDKLGDKLLLLDNVQDPGNLGTIIRSACAFDFDTVVIGNTSVSKYNEKVVRASQGMLFKINIITRNLSYFIKDLKEKGYVIYGTSVTNGENISKENIKGKLAIIMGNEGNGMSSELRKLADKNIYIKMNNTCESLNVAVAASIIMYEVSKED